MDAPHVDSPQTAPITASKPPITKLCITKISSGYSITGTTSTGGAVSWIGASRANAILQMNTFMQRLP